MTSIQFRCIVVLVLVLIAWPAQANVRVEPKGPIKWRAVHLLDYNSDADLDALGQNLERLVEMGINVVILEVDYGFAFKSYPMLRRGSNPITREGARKFAAK